MNDGLLPARTPDCISVIPVIESEFGPWLERQEDSPRRWLTATGFKAKPGSFNLVPDADGRLRAVVAGIAKADDLWALGNLPAALPEGNYRLDGAFDPWRLERMTLGWALGAYQFSRYKAPKRPMAKLALDPVSDGDRIRRQIAAVTLTRDLINTPAEDMMPEHLAEAMLALGREFDASVAQIVGDELLTHHFPLIHAVGRASTHPPRLLDLRWGNPTHPKVTLLGKGVCFDSGGLDLKPSSAMRLMKKDMGGAANVLGLAQMIMGAKLPVRLRVLIPAVENAISGNAFRPGDVLRSRKGLSVEIGNTDAEGRLVLADALALADEDAPDLLIDMATLTGAARVALGPDIAPFYTDDDDAAKELMEAAEREIDPVWRMPFWKPYYRLIDSSIGDINNAGEGGFGGSITAALFLKRFVERARSYVHFDIYAWTPTPRPARPKGGEAQAMRALFTMIRERYA